MSILFVFDAYIDETKIGPAFNAPGAVYLFPLTSRPSVLDPVSEKTGKDRIAEVLPSADMINASAGRLRSKYIRFVADLPGRLRLGRRNLRDIFAVDRHATLWWFSLIAEKNLFKSDAFNTLAQFDAIVDAIKWRKIDKVVLGCANAKLKDALSQYCRAKKRTFTVLPAANSDEDRISRVTRGRRFLYLKHIAILTCSAARAATRARTIKKYLRHLKQRLKRSVGKLLILTAYPNFDENAARTGIFKNRFYANLQENLETNSPSDITWAAMYVSGSRMSLKKSMEYAAGFIENGYSIFFPEEFISMITRIKAFFIMLISGVRFLLLERRIAALHDLGDYNVYSLFRDDWYSSFVGKTGYDGIIRYYGFKRMLKRLKAKKVLYHCEMRAWEKALISARDAAGVKTSLLAYQAGTVPRMHLNFFNHPSEILDARKYSLPRPDRIICNGRVPYVCMMESGWPEKNVTIAEAIRYAYLSEYLAPGAIQKKRDAVLIILSISPEESSSVLAVAYEALKGMKDAEIWVKPHPFLDIKKTMRLAGIPEGNSIFRIKEGPVEDFLSAARVVISGESSAVVEAVAFGCAVIIVNVPEWINMSPLRSAGAEQGTAVTVSSAEELKQEVLNMFAGTTREKNDLYAEKTRKAVEDFFCLGRGNGVPEKFLELLGDKI